MQCTQETRCQHRARLATVRKVVGSCVAMTTFLRNRMICHERNFSQQTSHEENGHVAILMFFVIFPRNARKKRGVNTALDLLRNAQDCVFLCNNDHIFAQPHDLPRAGFLSTDIPYRRRTCCNPHVFLHISAQCSKEARCQHTARLASQCARLCVLLWQ